MKIIGLDENNVQLDNIRIPAVNVQVNGFPQNIDGTDFGIYFEIPFPNGALWIISRMKKNGKIEVEMFPNFDYNKENFTVKFFASWADFLNEYHKFPGWG